MQIKEIMTKDPQCCTPEQNLVDVARMMRDCDCGAIPVVQEMRDKKPVGIITDRDITIRAVSEGKIPSQTRVRECMSPRVATVNPEASVEECARLMEEKQVRRLVAVNGAGKVVGMVVQAQIARNAPAETAGDMIKEISQPTPEMSRRSP